MLDYEESVLGIILWRVWIDYLDGELTALLNFLGKVL